MKNYRAFTLIEVMICIILTCIVVFFIYTMMLSSHRTYSKLFTISRQRNDLRYFETVFKKSIMNAEYFKMNTNNKAMEFGYYDVSGMFADGYRVDVYEFERTDIFSNDSTKSHDLSEVTFNSVAGTSSKMSLTIYRSNASYSYNNSTVLRPKEPILENVNKIFWCKYDFNEGGVQDRHSHFDFSLIFNKTLSDGEVNYESQIYRITMKNMRFQN